MTAATSFASDLLPRAGHAPGTPLWGEAPRRQPVAPLILMAVLLLVVAAPTALAGNGGSSNPLTLMKQVAETTYELTGLMQGSNDNLASIDKHSSSLIQVQQNMGAISQATGGMAAKTVKLNEQLGTVGASVKNSKMRLGNVDDQLGETGASMGSLRTSVTGSVKSTQAVVDEFGLIDTAIGSMDRSLKSTIGLMAKSGPLTAAFANNKTRLAVAGGDPKKYGVQNFAPDNRVMTIALGMLQVMQHGGPLPARKDHHEGSNFIINTALKLKVPDGTNVVANIQPFDGFYGLPGQDFFVQNKIHGF
ncbi:MAG: hypothetical protein JWM98_160 [Thermoleophilia bacterium]|nr:hypothetical protein [Thermoleophilia bacterium]